MSDRRELSDHEADVLLMKKFQEERQLLERLAEIGRDFSCATEAADKRQNAMAALEAIVEHFRTRYTNLDSLTTLQALFGDIENLNEGREVLFLKPKDGRAKVRPEKSRHDDIVLASASALVDHLVENGRSQADAAHRIIREMDHRKLAPPRQINSDTTAEDSLLNFRKRLRTRKRSNQVTELYFETKKIIASKDPEEAIRQTFDVVGPLGSKVR